MLFLQGGASTQFAMVPMNFLPPGATADYLMTGAWAEKAYEEAAALGKARMAASTKADGYRRVPRADEIAPQPRPGLRPHHVERDDPGDAVARLPRRGRPARWSPT